MSSVKKRKKKKLPIHLYLIYIAIATFLFSGVTLSKYTSTSEGSDSVSVALFANNTEVIIPVSECSPGEEFIVKVYVRNYDGTKVCEVSQTFEITAETVLGKIPLELDWIGVRPKGNFYAMEGAVEKMYELKVSWPIENGYPDSDYADEIEVIRILVDCEQID